MSKIVSVNPADQTPDGTPDTLGLIPILRWIDDRLQAIEDKLWPPAADGSGTGRYDNWTQRSDGKDYPGSYGVGPESAAEPLKPFVPFAEPVKPATFGSNPPFGEIGYADARNETFGISDGKGGVADVRPVPPVLPTEPVL